ncbi:unnamed protein product [Meloidogyne enterolobii]|uniref:Uncharacterized protein n=1 Tax=Meloidogyne enterolobii TaxID=390850 RepID=A0ACB0XRK5_MELEN
MWAYLNNTILKEQCLFDRVMRWVYFVQDIFLLTCLVKFFGIISVRFEFFLSFCILFFHTFSLHHANYHFMFRRFPWIFDVFVLCFVYECFFCFYCFVNIFPFVIVSHIVFRI